MVNSATSSAFFGIIATVTLVGNILVVIVLLRNREWLKKVHTCLLLALAIQDILTAICLLLFPRFVLPSDVYKLPSHPTQRKLYCSIIWSTYVPFALSIVSIYTCLMLAIDRWVAVLRPITYRRFCTSRKVIATMVIFSWISGFGFEIGTALSTESLKQDNGSYVCAVPGSHSSSKNATTLLFLVLGKGVLPAILMSMAYGKMVIKLTKTSKRVELNSRPISSVSNQRQNESHYSLKKLTRMVCLASATVIICWLPDQLYYCLVGLNLVKEDVSFHNGLHILAFLNTCLNPFLYSFSNKHYKKEFKKILCCLFNHNVSAEVDEETNDNLELQEKDLRS